MNLLSLASLPSISIHLESDGEVIYKSPAKRMDEKMQSKVGRYFFSFAIWVPRIVQFAKLGNAVQNIGLGGILSVCVFYQVSVNFMTTTLLVRDILGYLSNHHSVESRNI